MEGLFRPSKWWWLAPLVFLFFLVLALIQGSTLLALGWLCFLLNGVLVASGLYTRSWVLSYLALAFALLGLLFLVASIVRDFFLVETLIIGAVVGAIVGGLVVYWIGRRRRSR
jgi:hypothetical protein